MKCNMPMRVCLCVAMAATYAAAQDPAPLAGPQYSPEQIFRQWDKDGDGKLTRDETPQTMPFDSSATATR